MPLSASSLEAANIDPDVVRSARAAASRSSPSADEATHMRIHHALPLAALFGLIAVPGVALSEDIGNLHCNDANGIPLRNGEVVTVRGVLTANFPAFSNSRLVIQDATGGVVIFGRPQFCGDLGDEIEVTGTVGGFFGLTEVMSTPGLPLTITFISAGNPQPAPLEMTPSQVNATFQADNCEPNESRLVKVKNVVVADLGGRVLPAGTPFTANTNYLLVSTEGEGSVIMRIVQTSNSCQILNPLVGQEVPTCCQNVTGVITQFTSSIPANNVYEVEPRSRDDFEDCNDPVAIINGLIARVQGLAALGILDASYESGLVAKLKDALRALERENTRVAMNKLEDFISQINGLVSAGKLSPLEGQSLIACANAAVSVLTGAAASALTLARESPASEARAELHIRTDPSHGNTTIRLAVPGGGQYALGIFDVAGRRVRSYEGFARAGEVTIAWDGTDKDGFTVGRGLYFCRAQVAGATLTQKIMFQK